MSAAFKQQTFLFAYNSSLQWAENRLFVQKSNWVDIDAVFEHLKVQM